MTEGVTWVDSNQIACAMFPWHEQFCRCGCGQLRADARLVQAWAALVLLIPSPLKIITTSGYRCPSHNASLPMGSPTSLHMDGWARDWKIPGLTPAECTHYAEGVPAFDCGGIGIYDGHVHTDVRRGRRRWAYVGDARANYEEVKNAGWREE